MSHYLEIDHLKIDEQNRARALDLESFIVEAPAGAGKTELLTQRYLRLLTTVKSPEEIIAITFTNKAAAEMRLRIMDSLMMAASNGLPTAAHKQITYALSKQALTHAAQLDWQLLENPARLRIFTIDSLCAHLTRQMPLMSRFGTQPSVVEDASALYQQAAQQTLAELESSQYGELIKTALRYVDNNAAQLIDLLASMLAKRDQWLHHAQGVFSAEHSQTILRYLVTHELQSVVEAVPANLQQLLMPVAHYAAANMPADSEIAVLLDWHPPLQNLPEDLEQWRVLADFLLKDNAEPRASVDKRHGFPATDEGRAYKQTFFDLLTQVDAQKLHRVRLLPNLNNTGDDWPIINALSKLLNLAVAKLWLVFQRNNEVDFAEIASRATLALTDHFGEPTELALKLDYQIQHLLVDEFQDTSPSQIALIEQLTKGWQADDGRTLFCVGDPMQSIYRFRKANVSLFLQAAERGIGDISLKRLPLYRNNRSHPAVVSWINDTFQTIFPSQDSMAQGAISYRKFTATKPDVSDAGIYIHPIVSPADESSELAKQREAEAIIRIILATDKNKKIAILVRSKKHLSALVSKLRRDYKDIAFQAVEIEALEDRQVVQDLLSLTHALHHRADRVHWLAILRAPWCGLNLKDLYQLANQDQHSTIWSLMQNESLVNTLSADGQVRLRHVRDILTEAFTTQGRMPTSRWVRGIWLLLNGSACLWEQADITDVQAFFSCLDTLDRNDEFTPERMAIEVTKLFATPDVEGEHVQMMTIHKSKGLEFDTVILPGLGATTGGNNSDKPLMLWEEVLLDGETELLAAPYIPKGIRDKTKVSVYDYLETLEAEREANEAVRVLYVAATRAERALHLVGVANQNAKGEIKPVKNTYLDALWPVVQASFEACEVPATTKDVRTDIANFTPQLIRLQNLQMPTILQTKATSESAPSKPQTNPQNMAEDMPNLAADSGSLAHLYLEMIAKEGLAHWPVSRMDSCLQSMQFWLLQRGHAKIEVEKQVPHIIAALKTAIASPQGAWLLAPRSSTQTELSITTMDDNNQPQEHRIDLTFIEDDQITKTKTRWIIDFKLGLEVTAANANTAALIYKPQLARYASLFLHESLSTKTAVFFLQLGTLIEI
ncbi:MAG: UvrD-helicase domain-containing protein [Methylophilus sp.]|nr:UvrD-helicase domain-containing protein [Methylophilus sp.]